MIKLDLNRFLNRNPLALDDASRESETVWRKDLWKTLFKVNKDNVVDDGDDDIDDDVNVGNDNISEMFILQKTQFISENKALVVIRHISRKLSASNISFAAK